MTSTKHKKTQISIVSIASAVPPHIYSTMDMLNVTSKKMTPSLIESVEKIGVSSRYLCIENFLEFLTEKEKRKLSSSTTELGAKAARQCLQQAAVESSKIGLLIASTNTSNRHLPCFAYEVQNQLHDLIPSDTNVLNLENEGCS